MQVAPEKGSKAAPAQDLRSLSGGERSFSTLAFILALGSEIAACFHCLDEFDVFLDMQNRMVRSAPRVLTQHAANCTQLLGSLQTAVHIASWNAQATDT